MKVNTLRATQVIPAHIDKVWDFFSTPANLSSITPGSLGFNIISPKEEGIYPGQIIEYKVRPILNFPVYWMTEITHVEPQKYFVDEQRYGPYNLWHHKHYFKTIEEGVEMTDIVHYKMPLNYLGTLANRLFVRDQLNKIFSYRFEKVEEIFGKASEGSRQPDIIFT